MDLHQNAPALQMRLPHERPTQTAFWAHLAGASGLCEDRAGPPYKPGARVLMLRYFQQWKRLENKGFLRSAEKKRARVYPPWGREIAFFPEKSAFRPLK
jgi:hypothetical protein